MAYGLVYCCCCCCWLLQPGSAARSVIILILSFHQTLLTGIHHTSFRIRFKACSFQNSFLRRGEPFALFSLMWHCGIVGWIFPSINLETRVNIGSSIEIERTKDRHVFGKQNSTQKLIMLSITLCIQQLPSLLFYCSSLKKTNSGTFLSTYMHPTTQYSFCFRFHGFLQSTAAPLTISSEVLLLASSLGSNFTFKSLRFLGEQHHVEGRSRNPMHHSARSHFPQKGKSFLQPPCKHTSMFESLSAHNWACYRTEYLSSLLNQLNTSSSSSTLSLNVRDQLDKL